MAAIEPKLSDQIFIRQLAEAYEQKETSIFAGLGSFISENIWSLSAVIVVVAALWWRYQVIKCAPPSAPAVPAHIPVGAAPIMQVSMPAATVKESKKEQFTQKQKREGFKNANPAQRRRAQPEEPAKYVPVVELDSPEPQSEASAVSAFNAGDRFSAF